MTWHELEPILPMLLVSGMFVGGIFAAIGVFVAGRWVVFREFWRKHGVRF